MHVVCSLIKGAACNQIVHVGTIQIKRRREKKETGRVVIKRDGY